MPSKPALKLERIAMVVCELAEVWYERYARAGAEAQGNLRHPCRRQRSAGAEARVPAFGHKDVPVEAFARVDRADDLFAIRPAACLLHGRLYAPMSISPANLAKSAMVA